MKQNEHYQKLKNLVTISIPKGKLRPKFMDSPMFLGKEIEILMPNGEKRKGQFAVVELDSIVASHNENTFSSSEGYPVDEKGNNVNDRNYQDDPHAQGKVLSVAQNLEPAILVTTSRTPAGTPIITTDGFVVSGNNRTMSLKLALKNYPEKYEEYKKLLVEEAEAFGIPGSTMTAIVMGGRILDDRSPGKLFNERTDKDYIKMEHPVLVRFDYDFPEYTTLELSKYNKDTKKSERPIDKAIKLSHILNDNERLRDAISHIVGEYETFSDFYSNLKDQKRLMEILTEGNILTKQEIASYYTETGFNTSGKDLMEMILASIILKKEALIASEMTGVKRFRNIVITSLPVLVKNAALPEGSLVDLLNEAIVLELEIYSSGLSFGDYISQSKLFKELPERNVFILNRLLDSGRNNFKKSVEAYNTSVLDNQGENLFGTKPTLEEIFQAHIEDKIDPRNLSLIRQFIETESKTEDKSNEPFFEDHTSDIFLNEVRKFKTFSEFKKKYRELNQWIDIKDKAKLGVIRIEDTNWYPTKTHVDYSKNPDDYPFFLKLTDSVKQGNGIAPIVAEQSVLNDGRKGYTVRDGIHRLSAYEHAGIEFIPALVYETSVHTLTRDFDNPYTISVEEFLGIRLEEIYGKAQTFKDPKGGNLKAKAGSYEGYDQVIENVLIPLAVREPFASYSSNYEEWRKKINRKDFPDLFKLKISDLPQIPAAQMYELIQLGHPDEYKIKISRSALLSEWEKRGEEIFKQIGMPVDLEYPYVNKHTGYFSVDPLSVIIEKENETGPYWWWAAAEHSLPVADLNKAIEILDSKIKGLKEERKKHINPSTDKPKGKFKSEVNSIDYEIKELTSGRKVIASYLEKGKQIDKESLSLKEKKAKAQKLRLRLLKKKLQLQNKKK